MQSEFNLGVESQSETHLPRKSFDTVYFRKATLLHASGPFKRSSSCPLSVHSSHSSRNSFTIPPEITNNPLLKKRQMLIHLKDRKTITRGNNR